MAGGYFPAGQQVPAAYLRPQQNMQFPMQAFIQPNNTFMVLQNPSPPPQMQHEPVFPAARPVHQLEEWAADYRGPPRSNGSSPQPERTSSCGCTSQVGARSQMLRGLPAEPRAVTAFDPVNKQGYELRFAGVKAIEQGEHSEVLPTTGLCTHFSSRTNGSKRIFLCKQYQNGRCRASRNCNSIHVCKAKVQELRERNPPSRAALEADVLLPMRNDDGTPFEVPMDRTFATAGRAVLRTGAASGMRGTLCLAHEQRRCSDEGKCQHIHVDPAYLKHLRTLWKMPCCQDCGNQHQQDGTDWQQLILVMDGRQRQCSRCHSWPTKGCSELVNKGPRGQGADRQVRLPMGRVCRPHLRSACKWGSECNNVHLCRKRFASLINPQGSPTPSQQSPDNSQPNSPRPSPPLHDIDVLMHPPVAQVHGLVLAPAQQSPVNRHSTVLSGMGFTQTVTELDPQVPGAPESPLMMPGRDEAMLLVGNESFRSDGPPSLCNDSLCSAAFSAANTPILGHVRDGPLSKGIMAASPLAPLPAPVTCGGGVGSPYAPVNLTAEPKWANQANYGRGAAPYV